MSPKSSKKPSREDKKDAIVLAASAHVAFDGWGDEALAQGAKDRGYDTHTAKRLFPGGGVEAVSHFATLSDRAMMKVMTEADLDNMRVRDRVILGVRARLEFLAPHKEAVRRGLGLLMLPTHTMRMMKITHTTVDNIWYLAGDRAADFNYYTKRGLLGSVYVATVLFWLADESENHQETWEFLDKRIDNVLKIPPMKAKWERTIKGFLKGGMLRYKCGPSA